MSGLAYISSVYISYFLIGIGLLSIIQIPFITNYFYLIAGIIALIAGIINVKDFFYYGKGFSLRIPKKTKKYISEWTKKANIPAAIVLGFLVSLFEFPCTGEVYLVILALLAQQATHGLAIGYLLLYNLMFILPLLIILFSILFGFNVERVKSWKDKKKNYMKLATGLLLLILGAYMMFYYFA
jgi:cytochrome c biogenesis protein CcdA